MEVMKQLRQRAIRDLVEQRPIRTQQELAAALRERGFRTTQATISRDVAELGLIKVTREGTAAYALPPRLVEAETSGEDRLRKLLADLPIEIREAGLLLVLRTLPGSAHAIAAALDRARWPEVAGSVAGDDTVFVAFGDRGSLVRIKRRLSELTGGRVTHPQEHRRRLGSGALRSALTAHRTTATIRRRSELQVRGLAAERLKFFPLSKTAPLGLPTSDQLKDGGPRP